MAGVQFLTGARDFSLLHCFQVGSGAYPATYAMDTGNSFPGVKRLEREADHSSLSSAEVKKDGAIPAFFHTSSWYGA
jgi:hypothetical protein